MSVVNHASQNLATPGAADEPLPPGGPYPTGPGGSHLLTGSQSFQTHTASQPLADPTALARVKALDFRADGPPQRLCTVCGKAFRDWECNGESWEQLGSEAPDLWLCEEHYREMVAQACPGEVPLFTYRTWEHRQGLWEYTSPRSADRAHIRFDFAAGAEIMWCEALEHKGDLTFLVRLCNDSVYDPGLTEGTLLLARWDRVSYFAVSGRPQLTPLCRVRALPRRQRRDLQRRR